MLNIRRIFPLDFTQIGIIALLNGIAGAAYFVPEPTRKFLDDLYCSVPADYKMSDGELLDKPENIRLLLDQVKKQAPAFDDAQLRKRFLLRKTTTLESTSAP